MTFESTSTVPNTIPPSTVQTARDLWSQSRYAEAWNILAQAGDRYADNAAGVLGLNQDAADKFFQTLVRHHFENTVGVDAYNQLFDDVARDHLGNYLDILDSGFMPTTQDIVNSYEESLSLNGLDKSAAFDGAWAKALDPADSSWGTFLGMDSSRITTSDTTNNLSREQALNLLKKDIAQTVMDLWRQGLLDDAFFDLEKRGIIAVWDSFKDMLGGILDFIISPAYGEEVNPSTSNFFTTAQSWTQRRDPLTLDLDGDGLETVALNTTTPIYFDHDGDGNATATGWIHPDDGFLVLDRNGNGIIDSGRELFGDSTPIPDGSGGTRNAVDGFEALAAQDTNPDGKVDSNDANFNNLRIWQDLNQDAISQTNELFTLTQKNIASLNVAKTENNTLLPNGNVIADLGTYTKTDGTEGTLGDTAQLGDIDLREDTFNSQFTDTVPLTPEAQALPGMQGSGQVRDLREAASLSSNLTTLLTNYASAATRGAQVSELDALISAWSNTSTMATTATGAYAGHPLTVNFAGITQGTPEHQAWLDKLTGVGAV